jgi:hypothetical protein
MFRWIPRKYEMGMWCAGTVSESWRCGINCELCYQKSVINLNPWLFGDWLLGWLVLLFLMGWDRPLGTAATTGVLCQPHMVDCGDCGAVGGMKIGRGNRSTRRKPSPVPLCPPQIPYDQTQVRTRDPTVGSQWLTAWDMVRPAWLVC